VTLKKTALQTLSGIAAIGLTLGVAAPANALLADNIHNIAGGGVNIHADNTCVEKVGDTAHVKFEVQHQPLLLSSDHGQTAADGYIALPKNLKNVKIGLKAVADFAGDVPKEEANERYLDTQYREARILDEPIEMPIVDRSEDPDAPPMLGASPSVRENPDVKRDERATDYEDRGFSKKVTEDPNNSSKAHVTYLPTEQELRDHIKKFDVHMRKVNPVPYDDPEYDESKHGYTGPFMLGSGDDMWYGSHIKEYNIYEFGNIFMPASFEIEADVDVEHDDTFVTAATSNLGWKSSEEYRAGSYKGGSQSLQEYPMFRPGVLPPAIPEDKDMIQVYKDKLSDAGLDISPTIAPTNEMPGDSKYKYIGNDSRSSAREDVGGAYSRIFTLHSHKAVTYVGQVPQSGEDGADITAAHVTLCPSDETPPETETPETETPETETPDTETPETETPETETPETETPETETPETETPETETPETETPETETPDTETPDTETPGTETPETDVPETETPETETPETETPNTDTPETDTPETETPETDTPNTDTSETDTPAPAPSNDGDTGSRTLASTGASVIGIGVVALVLIGAGIFLSRRKKD